MSEKEFTQFPTGAKEQRRSTSTNTPIRDTFLNSPNFFRVKEDTYKRLPPRVKKIIQKEFKELLLDIQNDLKEFVIIVDDVQKTVPSEWEVLTVSPLTSPSETSSSNMGSLRELLTADSRPNNAPLRDAFNMVRNLLSKIAELIDKIALTTAVSDDSNIEVHDPSFDYYYAQYVSQIAFFVLQIVGENLTKFCKTFGKTTINISTIELPVLDANIDDLSPHVHLHHKGHNYCTVKNDCVENRSISGIASKVMKETRDKIYSLVPDSLTKSELKNPIRDARELLMFLTEKLLSSLQESDTIDGDRTQQRVHYKETQKTVDFCSDCTRRFSSMYQSGYCKSCIRLIKPRNEDDILKNKDFRDNGQKQQGPFQHLCHSSLDSSRQNQLNSETNGVDVDGSPIHNEKKTAEPKEQINDQTGTALHSSDQHENKFHSETHQQSAEVPERLRLNSLGNTSTEKHSSEKLDGKSFAHINDAVEYENPDQLPDEDGKNFDIDKFSESLKEEFKKYFSQYLKENEGNSEHPDLATVTDLVIRCFREAAEAGVESLRYNIAVPSAVLVGSSHETDVEDNAESSEEHIQPLAEDDESELDKVLEQFLYQTYKLAMYSLEIKRRNRMSDDSGSKILKKADSQPDVTAEVTSLELNQLSEDKTSSFSTVEEHLISCVAESSTCLVTKFKMSDHVEDLFSQISRDFFSRKSSDDISQYDCTEDCLKASVLHASHCKLPAGKMEVRQVNQRGHVVVFLEDWDVEGDTSKLIKCAALEDLSQTASGTHIQYRHSDTNDIPARKCSTGSLMNLSEDKLSSIGVESKNGKEKSKSGKKRKVPPERKAIIDKLMDFGANIRSYGYCNGPPLVLRLFHKYVFDETYETLKIPSGIPLSYYQKLLFLIYYGSRENELVDETEITFKLLGSEIFRAKTHGLFNYPSKESKYLYPNPASTWHIEWFEFVGIILALTIIQSEALGAKLPLCFYKCLLDRPLALKDLKEIDPLLHERLVWLKENDISEREKKYNFTVKERKEAKFYAKELIKDGENILITEDNKLLYIEKCVKWKLVEQCLMQFKHIITGFTSVLEPRFLSYFTELEIQSIVEESPCFSLPENQNDNDGVSPKRSNSF